MADKFLNETGIATIRDWANGKFALDSDLDALDTKVDGIIAEGGEPNVIETISVNGTNVPPTNKNVALTIPTATSDLTNDGDGTSNFATESYVDTNGGKIDAITVNHGMPLPITNKQVDIVVGCVSIDDDNNELQLSDGYNASSVWVTPNQDGLYYLYNKSDGSEIGRDLATKGYVTANGGKIDTISVNGTQQTITNKNVDITVSTKVSDLTNDSNFQTDTQVASTVSTSLANSGNPYQTQTDVASAISQAVASAYIYKGSVATVQDLPSTGQTVGDVYDVQATGVNYAWDGTEWDALGPYVDTSVLWTSQTGQSNTLVAMTVAEINAILEPTNP